MAWHLECPTRAGVTQTHEWKERVVVHSGDPVLSVGSTALGGALAAKFPRVDRDP